MLYEKKQSLIFPKEANNYAYGAEATFEIPRELPVEAMFLRVTVNWGTVTAPVWLADSVLGLIRRVRLASYDGASSRNVLDVSGAALVELAKHWGGSLDSQTLPYVYSTRVTGAAPAPSISAATNYSFIIPIFFCPPNLDDPLASTFLLPVDRYNANPELKVQIGASADLISSGTLTLSSLSMSLVVVRRIVNRLNWPIVDGEIIEQTRTYAATGDKQEFDLPISGYYSGILLRTYRTSAIRGDPSYATANDYLLATSSNTWQLELSGNTIRRFRLADVEAENDYSEAVGSAQGDILAGSYFLDFVSDRAGAAAGDVATALGSLLNANIPLNSGARLYLSQNIQVASSRVNYVYHRFYANLKQLQLS